jgi:glucokinase
MGTYCFGIDVGGTTVKCGLFQTDGTLVEKWEIVTRTENNGEEILPDIAKTIEAKIAERRLDKAEIEGVGIGVPGPVNENGDVLQAVNLFWGFKELSRELSQMTGLPAMAGNDANVAALGEAWKGAAAGAKSVIVITLGTGVGGGIIIDGKVVAGYHGAGGEVGHACMNHEETESCNCGNKGCLEQVASATGIVRVAKKTLAASEEASTLRGISELTAKDVLDAYKAGDALAAQIMDKVGDQLGGALAIFACVVDPEIIVIGGGVSKAGQPLIECIEKYYKKYAFSACKDTPIVLASLGNDAGMYGAARLVLNK